MGIWKVHFCDQMRKVGHELATTKSRMLKDSKEIGLSKSAYFTVLRRFNFLYIPKLVSVNRSWNEHNQNFGQALVCL